MDAPTKGGMEIVIGTPFVLPPEANGAGRICLPVALPHASGYPDWSLPHEKCYRGRLSNETPWNQKSPCRRVLS
jgi:hypothetical protein